MPEVSAYIGLGSNLDDPRMQIRRALVALGETADIRLGQDAGFYVSKPMGPEDQPDYVNTVVVISTGLDPDTLLDQCQSIERKQGRVRDRHWGERTIDLDILLYGDRLIETDRLHIPHPGITQRDFVYLPLLAIDADIIVPAEGRLKTIIDERHPGSGDYGCYFDGAIE